MFEAEAGHAIEGSSQHGIRAKPTSRDGFVGIEVHDPVKETAALEFGYASAEEGNQRGRGEGDDGVGARQDRHAQGAERKEAGKIGGAPPLAGFAEAGRADADDSDAAPGFLWWKNFCRIVVSAPAGEDGDLVAALGKAKGKIAQVLGCGSDVRVKGLVEEKEGHTKKLKS